MTPAFEHLMKTAPVLGQFPWPSDDPIGTLHRLRRSWDPASSGERCMIAPAFSFLPAG